MGGRRMFTLAIILSIVGLIETAPRTRFQQPNFPANAASVTQAAKGRLMKTQVFNPIFELPGSQSLPETKPYYISDPIKVVDEDAPVGCIERVNITIDPPQGVFSFWPGFNDPRNGFLTPAEYLDGGLSGFIKGTLPQINWAMANLLYTPPVDWSGSVNLMLSASDLGCGGGNGVEQPASISLTVVDTNTAPVINLHGYGSNKSPIIYTIEDQQLVLDFDLTDVDAQGQAMTMNMSTTNGAIALTQSRSGLNLNVLFETPTYIEITSNQYDLQTLLKGVVFTPSLHYNGLATLTIHVNDFGNQGLVTYALGDQITVFFNISVAYDEFNLRLAFPGCMEDSSDNPIYVEFHDRDFLGEQQRREQYLKVTASVTNGTLSFGQSTATVTYDSMTKSYSLFGSYIAIERATNGTMFTPDPDFDGLATLTMRFEDWAAAARSDNRAIRNITKSIQLTVSGINDAPRMRGTERTFHAKYGEYLIIDQLTAYDVDVDPLVDLIDVTINSTYGELTLGWRPYWLSPPAFMDRSLLPGNSHKNSREGFKITTTMDGLNKILGSIHDDHPGLGYLSTKPLPPAIANIDTPVLDVDYLSITINDRGHNGVGGPLESTFRIKVTQYVDQYATCQSFLDVHAQYCGCYFVSPHVNSSFYEWTILPLDWPSKLYAKETAAARFSQGCCNSYHYDERATVLSRVGEMGLCSALA